MSSKVMVTKVDTKVMSNLVMSIIVKDFKVMDLTVLFLRKAWRFICLSGLALLWVMSIMYPGFANAFSTNEMGDGLVEISTTTDDGFVISRLNRNIVKEGKHWVHFCVTETNKTTPTCFYGLNREFRDLKDGQKLLSIQYEQADRIKDESNSVGAGKGQYLYSVKIVRPAA